MKKLLASIAMVAAATLTGCASTYPVASIYQNFKLPVAATDSKISTQYKVGTSQVKSFCGLVAVGDASIQTAAKNGNITVIHHVDWEVQNVLGIIGTYRCIVYGE